jgi:hypothetical protein
MLGPAAHYICVLDRLHFDCSTGVWKEAVDSEKAYPRGVTIRGSPGLGGMGCQVLSRWLGIQPLAGKNQVPREFV